MAAGPGPTRKPRPPAGAPVSGVDLSPPAMKSAARFDPKRLFAHEPSCKSEPQPFWPRITFSDHSPLMFAALMIGHHFSISAF